MQQLYNKGLSLDCAGLYTIHKMHAEYLLFSPFKNINIYKDYLTFLINNKSLLFFYSQDIIKCNNFKVYVR